ncbi:MAG TPA: malic enzyme-like NAD(P)-binding protein [Acidiferrobacterales bacterium]|nr:malic enzyme-like NAD(P)-binding protein [Acidiferrobacterales bacterium]
MDKFKQQALSYHEFPKPGKISVEPSKACATVADLSLAYTPGVAEPVKEISRDAEAAYRFTNKGNLIAVITDGTAVLGLGNVGALAGKPVMEGKAVLFKRFAGIDVFDIEIKAPSVEAFIETVVNISPTFGGINLEDVAAPHCFEVEQALRERLDIPVFHDDQHGTAVIICAGLTNALEIQGKNLKQVRIVCLGSGAAGLASMRLLIALGADANNIILLDRKGVIHSGRSDLNRYKLDFARPTTKRTLAEAIVDADVFIGVSTRDLVTPEMLQSMAPKPVVFALANPDPEILPTLAHKARNDLIMATGRSDFPNQVNNLLGFPFIFRGALDARAKRITQPMLIAAVKALAELARLPVPREVLKLYNLTKLEFGVDYILPTPFDPRLIERIPPRIAEATRESNK